MFKKWIIILAVMPLFSLVGAYSPNSSIAYGGRGSEEPHERSRQSEQFHHNNEYRGESPTIIAPQGGGNGNAIDYWESNPNNPTNVFEQNQGPPQ